MSGSWRIRAQANVSALNDATGSIEDKQIEKIIYVTADEVYRGKGFQEYELQGDGCEGYLEVWEDGQRGFLCMFLDCGYKTYSFLDKFVISVKKFKGKVVIWTFDNEGFGIGKFWMKRF